MIFAPENSIIQFPETDLLNSCDSVISKCLPIHRSGDINFQIIIDDVDSAPSSGEYVMKLLTGCDIADVVEVPEYIYGTLTETFATILWTHIDEDGEAIGAMTQSNDDFDLGAIFDDGECFRIGIIKVNGDSYTYSNFYGVSGTDITIKLVIDGVDTTIGIFDYSDADDIADAIRTITSDQVTVLQAVNSPTVTITIHALGTKVYGNLTLGATVYAATVAANEDTLIACSNCFRYVADPCYTTVLKYRNNESAFGFNYDDEDFYNIVRLGLYLDRPQPISTRNVFRFSDGSYKTLSAVIEKEYEGHVDYYNEQIHFAIAIALKHDTVSMRPSDSNARFTGYVSDEAYEIEWLNRPGTNIDAAPAKFKVKETPFYEVNSNCE